MFSSTKMEEYIEPERSVVFWAKMVAKKYIAWVPRDPFYAYES